MLDAAESIINLSDYWRYIGETTAQTSSGSLSIGMVGMEVALACQTFAGKKALSTTTYL